MNQAQDPSDYFSNTVYLITGAANGFGHALSLVLSSYGATLILLDKDLRGLESLYDEIVKAGHPTPILHPMDLVKASPQDYFTLSEALHEQFEHLDGVIHNSALFTGFTPIASFKPEVWFEIMQANVNSVFLLTQLCLPLLNAASASNLVFIDHVCEEDFSAYWGAYGASKAACRQLMQTLSKEHENSSITVFGYDPGNMKTALRGKMFPAESPDALGDPETVANHLATRLCDVRANLHGKTISFKPN